MTDDDREVTVTLTVREARALANSANLLTDAFSFLPVPPGSGLVRPSESAAAKLELALMLERAEL